MADAGYVRLPINENGDMSESRTDDNNTGCCVRCFKNVACCCLEIVFYNRYVRCVVNLWKKYEPKANRNDYGRLDETQKQLQDEKEKNATLRSLLESMDFDLKESNESLKQTSKQLEVEKAEKEKALTRCNEQKEQLQEEQKKINDFKSRLEQMSKQLEVEKTEKEKALTRLSAVAGDKLRLNNPGIADLSDENRPNKLAEKFSELYDNEWTELYDELESGGKAEPDIVKEMLNLLQKIYHYASEMAEKQRKTLVTIIAKPSTTEPDQFDSSSDQILSKVIELQKQTVSMSIGNLKQDIAVKVDAQDMSEVKKNYYDRCVQLCWIMAIQDPPMMLDFGKGKGTPVNTDVFRMFTKQGTITDFVVWPAIYLHENGPLVQKGVLQPE